MTISCTKPAELKDHTLDEISGGRGYLKLGSIEPEVAETTSFELTMTSENTARRGS